MGLPKCDPLQKYTHTFWTIGPAQEDWGPFIIQFTDEYWRTRASYDMDNPPRLKFETSNDGYKHFHLGLCLLDRQKWKHFANCLNAFLMRTYPRDPPTLGYSVTAFRVPAQKVGALTLKGSALVNHYLDNPTKLKPTDGSNFTIELSDDWNIYRHITDYSKRLSCEWCSVHSPCPQCQWYIDETKALKKFAKLWATYFAKSIDPPPLTYTLAASMCRNKSPDLYRVEFYHKYGVMLPNAEIRSRSDFDPKDLLPPLDS